jgi:hypothetical protein
VAPVGPCRRAQGGGWPAAPPARRADRTCCRALRVYAAEFGAKTRCVRLNAARALEVFKRRTRNAFRCFRTHIALARRAHHDVCTDDGRRRVMVAALT